MKKMACAKTLSSDWERVIVIHSRDSNNMWAPSRALLSAHSGYHNLTWGDIQNTLTTDEINAGDAKDPDGVQNNDHPKVYVAWSKHPNFDTRNTGFNDPISQSLEDAFRSQDWWHFVETQNYVCCSFFTSSWRYLRAHKSLRFGPTLAPLLDRLLVLRTGERPRVIRPRCMRPSVVRRKQGFGMEEKNLYLDHNKSTSAPNN